MNVAEPIQESLRERHFGEMFELFRRIQKRNRFVGSAYGLELGLSDAHALIEIESRIGLTAGQLGQLIGLKKTSISYLVDRLNKRKLIKVKASSSDQRRKELSLSKSGEKLVAQLDRLANRQLDQLSSNFKEPQIAILITYLERFSDLHGVPAVNRRSTEAPLRTSIRRGTRALGLTSQSIFGGSNLNALQWHALAEIAQSNGNITALELCKVLAVKPNTLSAVLAGLSKRKLLNQTPSQQDRRRKILALTASADQLLKDLQRLATARLSERLSEFSMKELEEFVSLLRILAGEGGLPARQILQTSIYVEQLKDSQEIMRLRGLFVAELVKRNQHWSLPANLLGVENYIYVAYEQEQPLALAEIGQTSGQAELKNMIIFEDLQNRLKEDDFLAAVCGIFLRAHPYLEISLPHGSAPQKWSKEFSVRQRKEQTLISLAQE